MSGRRGFRPPGTADPAPERLWSLLYGVYPGFPGGATPPPGRVASVRAQPDRSPDGRDVEILSTPLRRSHPRRLEAGGPRQGGRARRNTPAGVR